MFRANCNVSTGCSKDGVGGWWFTEMDLDDWGNLFNFLVLMVSDD